MINRNEIVERLIYIRKDIYIKEIDNNMHPTDSKIKHAMDELFFDVIGDFLSDKDKEHIKKILLKAICDDISVEIAMVAIREIAYSYFSKSDNMNHRKSISTDDKDDGDSIAAQYYKKGYR